MDVAGGDDFSAEAPISVFYFVNFHQRVRTQRSSFNRDHGVGHIVDAQLRRRGRGQRCLNEPLHSQAYWFHPIDRKGP